MTARFDAFISYSYAADRRLASALQRCLHRLARPWYRPRALRVFRDVENLGANDDLWRTIRVQLAASRFFILLASPRAAASPWVRREVTYWQENRDRESFLIVLTNGEIRWDDNRDDFDWDRTTALPPQLTGWFRSEPLWVNLGWARRELELSLRHGKFRAGVATLAAPLHGRRPRPRAGQAPQRRGVAGQPDRGSPCRDAPHGHPTRRRRAALRRRAGQLGRVQP